MKEVTYEDWQENSMPRKMWVWRDNERLKVKRKVVSILREGCVLCRAITIDDDNSDYELYNHCAEIEKQRLMTNKELSRWLRENTTREYKWSRADAAVYYHYYYFENCADEEVDENIVVRENDGEWKEPLVEVEE